MRQCLAILFLIAFSLQIVPVKDISKLLSKGQGTEQVQDDDVNHDDATNVVTACYSDIILSRYSFDPVASSTYFENRVSVMMREAGVLPVAHVSSIPTPPPDFI